MKLLKVYEVTKCPRCGSYTCYREFDYDLYCFDIYDKVDEYVASVYPDTIEAMLECKEALKEGECPLCDNWEDGLGQTLIHALIKEVKK